ncbi:MAG: inositol monophosphatase family protein [Candidatus Odinarchaeota archaeon]
MLDYLNLLKKISSQVREGVIKLIERGFDVFSEKLGLNPSMQFTRRIDKIAEDITMKIIEEEEVPTYLISEEVGEKVIGEGEPEIFIVLDPVDGTRNALQRIPFFSTSLALGEYKDSIRTSSVNVALVKDIYSNTTFHAERGKGSYEDGKRINTSSVSKADNSLISLYAYRANINFDKYVKITRAAKIRTLGSQALELCYVAAGRIDACIDFRGVSRVVDISAAKLILEEAGGLFRDINGLEFNPSLKHASTFSFIAAPNSAYLADLMMLLSG